LELFRQCDILHFIIEEIWKTLYEKEMKKTQNNNRKGYGKSLLGHPLTPTNGMLIRVLWYLDKTSLTFFFQSECVKVMV
jgi:hypothetical protein